MKTTFFPLSKRRNWPPGPPTLERKLTTERLLQYSKQPQRATFRRPPLPPGFNYHDHEPENYHPRNNVKTVQRIKSTKSPKSVETIQPDTTFNIRNQINSPVTILTSATEKTATECSSNSELINLALPDLHFELVKATSYQDNTIISADQDNNTTISASDPERTLSPPSRLSPTRSPPEAKPHIRHSSLLEALEGAANMANKISIEPKGKGRSVYTPMSPIVVKKARKKKMSRKEIKVARVKRKVLKCVQKSLRPFAIEKVDYKRIAKKCTLTLTNKFLKTGGHQDPGNWARKRQYKIDSLVKRIIQVEVGLWMKEDS